MREAGGTDCSEPEGPRACPGAFRVWGWVERPGLAGQGCGLLGTRNQQREGGVEAWGTWASKRNAG